MTRIRDPQAGRDKLLRERKCRLCPREIRDGLTRAHLVPRGQGGDDVDDNLVPLCLPCHRAVDNNDWPTRRKLRLALTKAELMYCVAKQGGGWLDSRFPLHRTPEGEA